MPTPDFNANRPVLDIRTATTSDATAICEVIRRSIVVCCIADHRNDPNVVSAWLQNKTPANTVVWIGSVDAIALVAVRGSDLVGFALSNRDELALCYVAPEALHQGVGKGLLRVIESRALSRGVSTLRLDSTRTARDFYVRNGFSVSGPAQVWAGMEGTPMQKQLMADPLLQPTSNG
jgi:GNAT superfamily N-acetyltransferase